jgi:hypothetical protein
MIEGMPASSSTARPDRTAQPDRADLGEENRDAEADGNGDHHRDHGGDQRAVDRAERTQHRRIGRRRPALRPQEGEPYSLIAGQAPTISERMMPPRMRRTEIAQARVIQ